MCVCVPPNWRAMSYSVIPSANKVSVRVQTCAQEVCATPKNHLCLEVQQRGNPRSVLVCMCEREDGHNCRLYSLHEKKGLDEISLPGSVMCLCCVLSAPHVKTFPSLPQFYSDQHAASSPVSVCCLSCLIVVLSRSIFILCRQTAAAHGDCASFVVCVFVYTYTPVVSK